MLYNVHSINAAMKRFYNDYRCYPLSLYESRSIISDGYFDEFPANYFNYSTGTEQVYTGALHIFDERADSILLEKRQKTSGSATSKGTKLDLKAFENEVFESFEFPTSDGVLKYGVELESLAATIPRPSNRFSDKAWTMGNLCFGYELGSDIIEWWNIYPKDRKLDSSNSDRKMYREFARGNFVYLPLDEKGNPIPYNKAPTDFKAFFEGKPITRQKQTATGFLLVLFSCPDYSGLDVWTPTGNRDMPVALTPDGIPDGVIMSITRNGDEENVITF